MAAHIAGQQAPATLAGLLASSAAITLMIGFITALVLVYSLVLLVKIAVRSISGDAISGDMTQSAAKPMCANCSILHGTRATSGTSTKSSTDSLYASQSYVKCSECQVRFKPRAFAASTNANQHFHGKNLVDSTTTTTTTTTTKITINGSGDDVRNLPIEEEEEEEVDEVGDENKVIVQESESGACVSTKLAADLRELIETDDASCSMQTVYELRVGAAKPLPEPSASAMGAEVTKPEAVEATNATSDTPKHRVNWRKMLQASRIVNLFDQLATRRDQSLVPRVFGRSSISSNESYNSSASSSSSSSGGGATASEEPEFLESRKLRTAEIQIPIDAFNDSNTSEFDDVPGCDSRQDTSIDYITLGGVAQQQQQQQQPISSTGSSGANSNEHVMDADLRQVNRVNLELALLQNATQSAIKPTLAHNYHHQQHHVNPFGSVGGGVGGHHHQHLPQSGVLSPAHSDTTARRQSSEDADSGCHVRDSRRSSSALCNGSVGDRDRTTSETSGGSGGGGGGGGTPTAQVACIQLEVRKLTTTSGCLGGKSVTSQPSCESGPRSLLNALSSIGRSRSSECAPAPEVTQEADELYEVSLVEARNLLRRLEGGDNYITTTSPRASSLRGRRDSLLGALMVATGSVGGGASSNGGGGGGGVGGQNSPGSQRRCSVEGVFARVFKQQPGGGESSAISGEQVDYVQLPLVKLTNNGSGNCKNNTQESTVRFEQLSDGYKFTCKRSEFPLRLSFYQASKRTGARFTLGHCIVTPDDWHQQNSNNKFIRSPIRLIAAGERSNSSCPEVAGSGNQFAPISEHDTPTIESDHSNETRWSLEYRLYATILDAIKAQ